MYPAQHPSGSWGLKTFEETVHQCIINLCETMVIIGWISTLIDNFMGNGNYGIEKQKLQQHWSNQIED